MWLSSTARLASGMSFRPHAWKALMLRSAHKTIASTQRLQLEEEVNARHSGYPVQYMWDKPEPPCRLAISLLRHGCRGLPEF